MTTLLSAGSTVVFAQETPLTLVQIVTALQSTSSEMTLTQKNTFITQRVNQRGVTFTLTAQLTDELKNAGATSTLIEAIKDNGPQSNQTSTTTSTSKKPDVEFSKLWVEENVTRGGRSGMVVFTEFTVYNLNDVPLQLTIRFRDETNEFMKSTNQNFSNRAGELAVFKNFKPGYDAAVYKDWSVFVPYDEMQLPPGNHKVKISADIIYSNGELLKNMALYEVTVSKSKASLTAPRAEFEKMWVDYGVKEGGLLGMRIHVKLKTYNLKDTQCWLTINFEKEGGERLVARNTLFADRSGGVTLSSELTPGYPVTIYSDISVFMPYEELNLGSGNYSLKMHADLTYPDGGLIQHLNYYSFNFSQP